MIFLSSSNSAWGGNATLSWNPNTEANLKGYKIYVGRSSLNYTKILDVGLTNSPGNPEFIINNLEEGATYYFAVTAYNNSGEESTFSNEVAKIVGVGVLDPSLNAGSAASGGGCGMVRPITSEARQNPGQTLLNLALLALLISIGKLKVFFQRRLVGAFKFS
jgi:hypothetical protein